MGEFIEMSPDPADSRRQIYTLSPQVQVHRSESGALEMDFGYCVLRLAGTEAGLSILFGRSYGFPFRNLQ